MATEVNGITAEHIRACEEFYRSERRRVLANAPKFWGKRPTQDNGEFSELVWELHRNPTFDIPRRNPLHVTYDEILSWITGNNVVREDWLSGIAEGHSFKSGKTLERRYGNGPFRRNLAVVISQRQHEIPECWRSMHHSFYWERDVMLFMRRVAQELIHAERRGEWTSSVKIAIREARAALSEFRKQLRSLRDSGML